MKADNTAPESPLRSDAMGTGSIWRLLYNFSGPSIIAMLVASSYILFDAIFVGMLGTEYQAAMTVVMPLMMVFVAFSQGIGVGGGSFIGRKLGARKHEEANRICGVTISFMLIVSAVLTALFIINLKWILASLGASERVAELAYTYGVICVWFSVVNCTNQVLANIVRAEGNPKLASSVQIISAICNIITDPLFILGWLGFPRLEIAGAAWTTVFSWAVGIGIYTYYFVMHKTQFSLKWRDFIPELKIIMEITRVGLASVIRILAGSFVQVFGNTQAAAFGVVPLAVKGVLMSVGSFFFLPTMGIGQGALPLLAYNYGARKRGRMGEILYKSCLISVIWGGVCFIAALFFPRILMGLFGQSAEFLDIGVMALRIFSLSFFTIGVQMIMSFYFQAIGEGISSLFLASSRQIVFLAPLMYILPRIFGINGLWLTFPISDWLAFVITAVWTYVSFKKNGIPFKLNPAPDWDEVHNTSPVAGNKKPKQAEIS